MSTAVKKTISLPADLARDTEAVACAQGKTVSTVIQEALRDSRIARRLQDAALQRITEERDELCQSSRISVQGCLAEREQRPAALAVASLQRFKAHALSADRPVTCWAMARG